jgi:hypothetical protein
MKKVTHCLMLYRRAVKDTQSTFLDIKKDRDIILINGYYLTWNLERWLLRTENN